MIADGMPRLFPGYGSSLNQQCLGFSAKMFAKMTKHSQAKGKQTIASYI